MTNLAFVNSLYVLLLNRQPDEAGMQIHLEQIKNGVSRLTLIEGVLNSAEYQLRAKPDEEYVRDLYRVILQRDPDEGGLRLWLELVGQEGRASAFRKFCDTQEATLRYLSSDSYLDERGECGLAQVVFRSDCAVVRLDSREATAPIRITSQNWQAAAEFFRAAGFTSTANQLQRVFAGA